MSRIHSFCIFKKVLFTLIAVSSLALFQACSGPNGGGNGGNNGGGGNTPQPDPNTGGGDKPTPVTINENSVVINDLAALATPFAFSKTMDQIVATSGGAPTSSALMLKSVVDSFAAGSFVHPVSGKTIPVDSRPLESAINPNDLLNPDSADGMIPVGLFNRFDLAPADGSNCGEYRIVYAKKSSGGLDRMTMIFEARVPNPNPSEGIAGCAPITDFWAARSGDSSVSQTVTELEKLYYQGIPGVEPVVKAENYGLPMGQLRVNLFKTPNPGVTKWTLREFLVNFDTNGRAIFKEEPVDDSPVAELFRASSAVFNGVEETEFRTAFLGQPLCNLVNPDRVNNSASAADIINGIGAGYSPKFNDFESISQDPTDEPAANTDPALSGEVQTRLAALPGLSGVSSVQAMNRAGTMTCGGCHEFSANKDLGNGAAWPASLGFVHIDESGALSPLLNNVFIPKRVDIAEQFRGSRVAFQGPAMPCPGVVSTSAGVMISDATQPREHDLYKDVDQMRNQIQEIIRAPGVSSEKSEKLATELPKLQEAIEKARKEEGATRGAFSPVRRSH